LLAALPWRGGPAEFTFVLEQLTLKVERPVVRVEDVLGVIDIRPRVPPGPSEPLRDAMRRFEREFIADTLNRHDGEIVRAARALGLHRPNLYRKLRALGLTPRRTPRQPD
jgi:DNA-binding NtrC family response regulator